MEEQVSNRQALEGPEDPNLESKNPGLQACVESKCASFCIHVGMQAALIPWELGKSTLHPTTQLQKLDPGTKVQVFSTSIF